MLSWLLQQEPLPESEEKDGAIHTVDDIRKRLEAASKDEFAVLERSLCADTRKGVKAALAAARRRIEGEEAEERRLEGLYAFEHNLSKGRSVVGLDEVGRGPLAGPLAVGAVVLPPEGRIAGIDDSKKLSEKQRESLAIEIKAQALAWTVVYIEPDELDAAGMALSLRIAFSRSIRAIEAAGVVPAVVLIDGHPLRVDDREISVVKGDSRCASIAAASIVAKVERDAVMRRYAQQYPHYGFEKCKGYASAKHIEAIKEYGLSPVHRVSFCTSFLQESLF